MTRSSGLTACFSQQKNNIALLYNAQGDNEKARQLFFQILENNSQMHEINYSIGFLLAEEKKYNKALVYLQRAAIGLPHRAKVPYNLGLLLQYLGKDTEAEKVLLKALSIDSTSFDFFYALVDHYIKGNRLDHAFVVADKMIALFSERKIGYDIRNYADHLRQKNRKSRDLSKTTKKDEYAIKSDKNFQCRTIPVIMES